ncbi:flagellar basal body P-ring formation chaperone FlgA [Primorskyibacter sp. S187A]|uniref:flagellar basal body P-ring formation chaperone FlgA n=1 Tax=Primorskyibacter sp. S187A TaxID=3415130 RepID=UPI003C7A6ED0
MKRILVTLIVCLCGTSLLADILVPTRTIRPNTMLSASDFAVHPSDIKGAIRDIRELQGMESRVALYAGRPVHPGDIGPPALVERNEVVQLVFSKGGLEIFADGRALGRGAAGDSVRVMNLASRTTLFGIIQADGSIKVGQ